MNLRRTAQGGRNFAYYAEDPVLPGMMAAATIRGAQEQGVMVTIKQFAMNNEETNARSGIYCRASGQAMRELYLRPFEIAVKEGAAVTNPYKGDCFAPYCKGTVQNVSDESFAALLGHEIPNPKWDRSAPIGFNDTIAQGEYLTGGLGRHVYKRIACIHNVLMAVGKKELGNNVIFFVNLPWRGVARMSGVLTDSQVPELLDVINRKKADTEGF